MTTLSWQLIFACFYFGQPLHLVISGSRKAELLRVRQIVQYIMFENRMTYEQIAELNGVHWETVRSNVRNIRGRITPCWNGKIPDLKLKQDIETLMR
jgi:hypothetical protein